MPAVRVAQHIAAGLARAQSDAVIDCCPIADGGEGFTNALANSVTGEVLRHSSHVVDPLGRAIEASWLSVVQGGQRFAAIELADASGLERLDTAERNPLRTSTFGTGAVLREALDAGVTQLLLGIGGSATNDGGCGIAQALGVRMLAADGHELDRPVTGDDLLAIHRIDTTDLDARLRTGRCALRVACDVSNPLTGAHGAAYVYGPQKGAGPKAVERLDAGLRHLAALWRDQLGCDVQTLPGSGAAGGVGGGLVAMCGASLEAGADLVLDSACFDERAADADLVITGEGRLDGQSLRGKSVMAVARRCKRLGVPCIALVGCIGEGADEASSQGLTAYRVIGEGLPPDESIRRTGELLEREAERVLHDHFNGRLG